MEAQSRLKRWRRVALWPARGFLLALATWLVVLAVVKFENVGAFADAIGKHGVVPIAAVEVVAWGAPALEILFATAALWTLVGRASGKQAGVVLAAWMTLLAAYSLYLTIRPPAVPAPCGCGLAQAPIESWSMIALRNAGLTAAALAAAFLA